MELGHQRWTRLRLPCVVRIRRTSTSLSSKWKPFDRRGVLMFTEIQVDDLSDIDQPKFKQSCAGVFGRQL
jgi:hypothetical protein